jgi:hypothetical protein
MPTPPAAVLALFAAALLAACAPVPLMPGQARDEVIKAWGAPTARYALPQGERLEYATGPHGRTTWMVDVDAAGRVKRAEQVLNEAHFADFQGRAPGMSVDALLRELGTPGQRQMTRMGDLWSWRYPTNDCLWFQVSFDKDGRVAAAGYNIDPRCDPPTARE